MLTGSAAVPSVLSNNPWPDSLARKGTLASLSSPSHCYRCGQDPYVAHDKSAFCPAFSNPREAGRWIEFSKIRRAIEHCVNGTSIFQSNHYCDWPEGPFALHPTLGLARDGAFLCRLDYPVMPEFSIYSRDYRGRWSPDPDHDFLFIGWRRQFRMLERRLCLINNPLFIAAGADPSVTTEEAIRHELGWS
jgi:hypothetical protein